VSDEFELVAFVGEFVVVVNKLLPVDFVVTVPVVGVVVLMCVSAVRPVLVTRAGAAVVELSLGARFKQISSQAAFVRSDSSSLTAVPILGC
jgi:hypothetical protein